MNTKTFRGSLAALLTMLLFLGVSAEEKKVSDVELLLNDINELRVQHKKKPVRIDSKLMKTVQAHNDEMIKENYFSHDSPHKDNHGPSERADNAGYNWFNLYENIFRSPEKDQEAYLKEAMADWIDSPIHKDNLLAEKADDIGIAVGRFKDGDVVITVLLGRD